MTLFIASACILHKILKQPASSKQFCIADVKVKNNEIKDKPIFHLLLIYID